MERRIDRIYFELTTMCNLRCKHCFNFNSNFKSNILTFAEIKQFYEKVKNKTNGIVLTGGEPFLHPEIKKIITLLRTERVVITTNATLFGPKFYEEILKENPNIFLQISFDGFTKAAFEEVRGKHTYDKVRNVIDNLSAKGYGHQLGLSMSILACNVSEVMDVIKYAKKCKLHSVHFPTLIIEGRCADDISILPDVEKLNKIEDQLLQAAIENENLLISVNSLNRVAGWAMIEGEHDCLSNATVKITVDRDIMPCPVAWKSTESMGKISQITSYEDLVGLLRDFKVVKRNDSNCTECSASVICKKNFCECCSVRKINIEAGTEYRCKNYKHHINNIIMERKNEK